MNNEADKARSMFNAFSGSSVPKCDFTPWRNSKIKVPCAWITYNPYHVWILLCKTGVYVNVGGLYDYNKSIVIISEELSA